MSQPGVVCFGEILWDILPAAAVPGGAPMNVAYHLHQLGIEPGLITRIGKDENGNKLMQLLSDKNINTDHVQHSTDTPTGIVYGSPSPNGDMKYEIVFPSAWDYIETNDEIRLLVKNAEYFIFGSLAARNQASCETLFDLLNHANNKVLDINLRAPHFNRQIIERLLNIADIVKMNDDELRLITGWFGNFEELFDQMNFLMNRYAIRSLIVTRGANGAVVNMQGSFISHDGYKVKVSDTVGSGDSFLAALLAEHINKVPVEQSLNFASALGAFVASQTGGWPSYTRSQIENIASGNDADCVRN